MNTRRAAFLTPLLVTSLAMLAGCTEPPREVSAEEIAQATAPVAAPVASRAAAEPEDARQERDDSAEDAALPVPGAGHWLAWAREVDGDDLHTFELDDAGVIVAEYPTAVLALGDEVWSWETETVPRPTRSCEELLAEVDEGEEPARPAIDPVLPALVATPAAEEGGAVEADEGTGDEPGCDEPSSYATRGFLRSLRDGREVEVVAAAEEEGSAEMKHDATLVAQVGPYLFLHEDTYSFGCGAHGNTGASATIWDGERAARVDPSTLLADAEATAAAARAQLEEDADGLADDAKPELTEIVPHTNQAGSFVVGHRWTTDACFACSHGGWSSYTASVVVDAPSVPRALAPFATAPAPVRALLGARPGLELGGFSRVPR